MFTTLQHSIKKNRIIQEYVRPHERAVKTITDATPWQDLYFNEEQGSNWGRSRTIAFAKDLYQKYDSGHCKEVPSVVYEDDTVDELADSPGSPRKNKEGQVAAPKPMAETVKVSNDDNTEMAAVSGKIKSVEQAQGPYMANGERPTHYYALQKKGSADASNLQYPSMRTQSRLPTTFGDSHVSDTNGNRGSGRLNGLARSALVQNPVQHDLMKK